MPNNNLIPRILTISDGDFYEGVRRYAQAKKKTDDELTKDDIAHIFAIVAKEALEPDQEDAKQ